MQRIPVEQHAAHVAALLEPLRIRSGETVPLAAALGRVTSASVTSPIDLPPFRNSQMDGFAVRAAEIGAGVALPIAGEVAAAPGAPDALRPGAAVRIMTGAPMPAGADAVVPVEETAVTAEGVTFTAQTRPGRFVREAGSDLGAGGVVLPEGLRLAPRHLAALAASGLTEVSVRARVRVAVISSGSELVEPGQPLGAGQIPDANGVALAAAVVAAGADVALLGRVRDEPAELRELLDDAIDAGCEVVITSGGISMGEHEVVREVLEPLGARVGTVAMQPGGPQGTAAYRDVPVICFPGNPVSSQLSFEIFVAPLLRKIAGIPAAGVEQRVLETSLTSPEGRRQYLRGTALPGGLVAIVGGTGSHLVTALAASDTLIVIPEDVVALDAGEVVETLTL